MVSGQHATALAKTILLTIPFLIKPLLKHMYLYYVGNSFYGLDHWQLPDPSFHAWNHVTNLKQHTLLGVSVESVQKAELMWIETNLMADKVGRAFTLSAVYPGCIRSHPWPIVWRSSVLHGRSVRIWITCFNNMFTSVCVFLHVAGLDSVLLMFYALCMAVLFFCGIDRWSSLWHPYIWSHCRFSVITHDSCIYMFLYGMHELDWYITSYWHI